MPSGPRPPPTLAVPPLGPPPDTDPEGVPGLGPSGEIETRAERFPAGIAGGATGAGDAESAISVSGSPGRPLISGAAAFDSVFCIAARGADIGFTGSRGFAGACEDAEMSIAPASFSVAEISGAATFAAESDAGVLGRNDVSSVALSCSFGRSGWELAS